MEAKPVKKTKADEEAEAKLDMWKYVLGFTPTAVVKCAIELEIADVLESSNGGTMTHIELSTALGCSTSILYRFMRYLMHHGFFATTTTTTTQISPGSSKQCQDLTSSFSEVRYVHTPLSRLLIKTGVNNSMASLVMLESSQVMLAPWHNLSARALTKDGDAHSAMAFGSTDLWKYAASDPTHSKLLNDGLACRAKTDMLAIIDQCPQVFKGISSIVDVGGGNGTTLHMLMDACLWISRAINFDLPHVVSVVKCYDDDDDDGVVEHVAGDMFKSVPKADAAFLMHVLHDWNDEECIRILRNCREAVPKDSGKVIIAEAVLLGDQPGGGNHDVIKSNKYVDVQLALDMVMLAHTETGRERSMAEWDYVLNAAGFSTYTVIHIEAIVSIIEAHP